MLSDVQFDIWSLLLAFGVFQGFFLVPLILKGKKPASWFLAALVLVISLLIINYLFLSSGLYRYFPHFILAPNPLFFLIGPLYYFYTRSLTSPQFRFQWSRQWPHFLAILPGVAFHWNFYVLSGEQKVGFFEGYFALETLQASWWVTAYSLIHILQSLSYIYLAGRLLSRAKSQSGTSGKSSGLRWLIRFNAAFCVYWLIDFAGILWLTLANGFFHEVDYILMLSSAAMIHLLAFIALRQHKVFAEVFLAGSNGRYEKSGMNRAMAQEAMQRLEEIMSTDKPHLEPALKLGELADRLELSTNALSQLLNEHYGKTFYEFVNSYRLEEVKKKLGSPGFDNYTILGVALECGFNNKNTFNRYFKKEMGLTPSAYLKSLR
jgi:AraC-like DNA-binding protein